MANGERDELKLSNGFASGGDIKLDTEGNRFMLILVSCREGNTVIILGGRLNVVDRRMDATAVDGEGGNSVVGGRGR